MTLEYQNCIYRVTRRWDNYDDCPTNTVDYWLGLWFRNVFIGITWSKYSRYTGFD